MVKSTQSLFRTYVNAEHFHYLTIYIKKTTVQPFNRLATSAAAMLTSVILSKTTIVVNTEFATQIQAHCIGNILCLLFRQSVLLFWSNEGCGCSKHSCNFQVVDTERFINLFPCKTIS
jgi:hypothetical protein